MPHPSDYPPLDRRLVPASPDMPAKHLENPEGSIRYQFGNDIASGGFLEYWGILRRHMGVVLLFALLGLIAAVLVTLPQTPIYQARASVEIQALNQDFMNMRQINPVSEGATDYYSNDIQTHIK